MSAPTLTVAEAIDLGDGQWSRIASAADGDFVRVPVAQFAEAAMAWRWTLGVVPQTSHVAKQIEPLESLFGPPSDIGDTARALVALREAATKAREDAK